MVWNYLKKIKFSEIFKPLTHLLPPHPLECASRNGNIFSINCIICHFHANNSRQNKKKVLQICRVSFVCACRIVFIMIHTIWSAIFLFFTFSLNRYRKLMLHSSFSYPYTYREWVCVHNCGGTEKKLMAKKKLVCVLMKISSANKRDG